MKKKLTTNFDVVYLLLWCAKVLLHFQPLQPNKIRVGPVARKNVIKKK